jgi:hypothetical protein
MFSPADLFNSMAQNLRLQKSKTLNINIKATLPLPDIRPSRHSPPPVDQVAASRFLQDVCISGGKIDIYCFGQRSTKNIF